jgi:hypothetical protein
MSAIAGRVSRRFLMMLCAEYLDPLGGLDSQRRAACGWVPAARSYTRDSLTGRVRPV